MIPFSTYDNPRKRPESVLSDFPSLNNNYSSSFDARRRDANTCGFVLFFQQLRSWRPPAM